MDLRNQIITIKSLYIMTHSEFLTMMVDLEFAINKLSKALEQECEDEKFIGEDGEMDINRYMMARNIVNLSKGLTTTKLSIDYLHKMVYGEE